MSTRPTASTLPGSFDLVEFEVTGGDSPDFKVTLNSTLADPWGMGIGFAVQNVFVFIDKDGVAGSGHTDSMPGLNVSFAPESAWEKVVVLSPQPATRVAKEAEAKASDQAGGHRHTASHRRARARPSAARSSSPTSAAATRPSGATRSSCSRTKASPTRTTS